VFFFLVSQVLGLYIISKNFDESITSVFNEATNQTENVTSIVPYTNQYGASPSFGSEEGAAFLAYIIIAILIATILFLFLVNLKKVLLWKLWFFFAVFLCLSKAFFLVLPLPKNISFFVAGALGFVLAFWKIFRPTIVVHNLTELFVYGGLAAILVPIPAVTPGVIIFLLVLVSAYDAYSVWKSKHMVKMAQFQAHSNVFAGLLVPYKKEKIETVIKPDNMKTRVKSPKGKVSFKGVTTAVLGGGDVAFPLLFAGAVLKSLILVYPFSTAFFYSLIISLFAGIALFILFIKGRNDRFYPAIPFLTIGCLVGYLVVIAFA
jgi:presenilin-like A22 family membrane protease